jgi:hypothetical protein
MQSHLEQHRLSSAAILRFETARSLDAGRDGLLHAGEIRRAFGALLT